ncbi:MAG: hypothetical protein A3G87_02745 [Omnitrophica bacterium RIFCSPLOWO2_12_FULL_50_11]|nr:MAG: hypothetical protein A3G87_02745 [Omnitrophica bacterium RIFCSPLOWO2_12_FULL_50_11]
MKTVSQWDWIVPKLEDLKAKNLFRQFRVLEDVKATSAIIEGRRVTLFCGNDYLGLCHHPRLIEAAHGVLRSHGVGAGSARLIAGTSHWHDALETRIAKFLGKESALIFSSGYLANLGALSALTEPNDLVILDKLSHASLIDAARLCRATVRVYPHRNLGYLEKVLKTNSTARHPEAASQSDAEGSRPEGRRWGGESRSGFFGCLRRPQNDVGRVWIVTDSLFSMDGDLAPLRELVELKNRYGAYLIIDEAHATGVYGAGGRGVSEHLGVMDEIDVHIGTCSKAIGTLGGFVAGSTELIQYLVNHARTFIFDTALPASACAASIKALDLIDEAPELRASLWRNSEKLRNGLDHVGASLLINEASPIVPVVLGDEKKALEASDFLLREGFLVPAVRYPTVPRGKARLRVTLSAAHSDFEIDQFLAVCQKFFMS